VRKLSVLAILAFSLTFSTSVFGQSTYATVSGTIEDPSHALLPGVTVTATNDATGVMTNVVSNESGAYNVPTLLPGTYTVKAELPGFQTKSFTNVQLGNAAQVRLNFTLQVASQAQSVEVTVAADTLLATSSSSIGEVLSQQKVEDLPIVGNNVLSFFTLMPGVRMNDDGVTGTFAGLSADKINVQRDGIDASASARYVQAGAQTATFINPDLVGEIRIITAPVDAELGRGNGQVQFLTRSGTNQFRGSGVWYARNSGLDANTWLNNRAVDPKTGGWKPTKPDWNNTHEFTGNVGGPIVKNKTFFFTLFDDVLVRARTLQNPIVLTPCARNGIFRYFDLWNNGNAVQPLQASGGTPTIAVVDGLGNPVTPATNPNGSAFTGSLHYVSVYGKLPASLPQANSDCSTIAALLQPDTNWDTYRKALDPTGYVTKLMGVMQKPNNYEVGDGLNTAGYKWSRNENNGTENIFGYNGNLARKQINIKVDHNFNAKNKLGVAYTYEHSSGNANYATWPGGYQGQVFRNPQTLSFNFVSTLSPTLVNEARLGMRRTGSNTYNALNTPGGGKGAADFLPSYSGYPVMLALGAGATNFQTNQIIGGGSTSSYLDTTVLWTYGDSLSWTKGKHAFKMGGEIRRGHSLGFDAGIAPTTVPRATGGETGFAPISAGAISATSMPGLAGNSASGNNAAMRNLLDFLAGSLASVTQLQFMENPTKLSGYEDYKTFPWRTRDFHGNEASIFFKDDWKVRSTLTLNLGLRWDYYGVPYEGAGLMPAAVGGPSAIWGVSGSGFSDWMKPGIRGTNTSIAYFGKNSPNSGTPWYEDDHNNFGPAVGFAWQVPKLGAGKTTVRGGYQITYQIGQSGNNIFQENAVPGSTNNITYGGDSLNPYIDLTRVQSLVPVPTAQKPMQPVPTTDRSQQVYNPEKGVVTPYTQNLTLAVTRSLTSNLTLDVRYVGTLARKQWNPVFNINIPDFLYNGLKDAFDAVRAGDDLNPKAQVLENMFKGINILGTGFGPVGQSFNGVLQTAGLHLRNSTQACGTGCTIQSALANGQYSALAGALNTLNYTSQSNPGLPPVAAGVQGAVMRQNNFPENFIVTNPQFAAVNLITNDFSSNYHSLEAQVTMRPIQGVTMQSTYTWSKNMGTGGPFGLGPTYTNPVNRHADYSVQTDTRVHDFRTNGTFALPVGPNKFFFGTTSGTVARFIEGWQTGWIVNLNTGAPTTITANNSLYANGRPDIVGPFPVKDAKVTFEGTAAATGSYWKPGTFATVKDPQCLNASVVAASLQSACTLNAITDAKTGQVLIQNAMPGTVPTMGLSTVTGPGRWRFDANISKAFRISESKNLQFRLDATDILNHPEPGTPTLNITGTNAANFGLITTSGTTGAKTNLHRQLQAQLRFNF
jgi:hypothetical protein